MGFYGTPHNGILIHPWHNEITYIFEGISIYYGMEIFIVFKFNPGSRSRIGSISTWWGRKKRDFSNFQKHYFFSLF